MQDQYQDRIQYIYLSPHGVRTIAYLGSSVLFFVH